MTADRDTVYPLLEERSAILSDTQQTLEAYEAWRQRRILEPPDTSIAAYLRHLEAEAALEALKPKEIDQ